MTHSNILDELKKDLAVLRKKHHLIALKTGTEVEDMDFDEIQFLKDLAEDLPLVVKIGGPEARNDMRHCINIGVHTILAPMVESVYALNNFVQSMEQIMKEMHNTQVKLALNIESVTAVKNFDNMLSSVSMKQLAQITIGRSDLSRSMHLPIDDPEVISSSIQIIKKANNIGLITSVGGGVSLENIQLITRQIPAKRINTRHSVFNNSPEFALDPEKHLYWTLNFEKKLYLRLSEIFVKKKNHYEQRAKEISMRMGNMTLIKKEKSL